MSAPDEELAERLKTGSEERTKVMDPTRSLGEAPRQNRLRDQLHRFTGTFTLEEAEAIKRAIDEEFERVDSDQDR